MSQQFPHDAQTQIADVLDKGRSFMYHRLPYGIDQFAIDVGSNVGVLFFNALPLSAISSNQRGTGIPNRIIEIKKEVVIMAMVWSFGLAGAPGRKLLPSAENQGECRSEWSRCWRAPAVPVRL